MCQVPLFAPIVVTTAFVALLGVVMLLPAVVIRLRR